MCSLRRRRPGCNVRRCSPHVACAFSVSLATSGDKILEKAGQALAHILISTNPAILKDHQLKNSIAVMLELIKPVGAHSSALRRLVPLTAFVRTAIRWP